MTETTGPHGAAEQRSHTEFARRLRASRAAAAMPLARRRTCQDFLRSSSVSPLLRVNPLSPQSPFPQTGHTA
jgi:hypothetical protein